MSSKDANENTLTPSQQLTLNRIRVQYGQSYSVSGSETDVSTSTENLSPEERYALEHTQRQEPQGQENVFAQQSSQATAAAHRNLSSLVSSSAVQSLAPSRPNDSNASMSSSTNTLIIHNTLTEDTWSPRWMPGMYSTPNANRNMASSSSMHDTADTLPPPYNSHMHKLNMESLNRNSSLLNSSVLNSSLLNSSAPNSNLLHSAHLNSSILDSPILPPRSSVPSYLTQNALPSSPKLPPRKSSQLQYSNSNQQYSNSADMNTTLQYPSELQLPVSRPSALQYSTELPDIPSSYLDQSEVLKHLVGRDGSGKSGGMYSDQSASSSNSGINLISNENKAMNSVSQTKNESDNPTDLDFLNMPPPPAYPKWRLEQPDKIIEQDKRLNDKPNFSRSQPDLTRLANTKEATSPNELLSQRFVSGRTDDSDGPLREMVDILTQENDVLKRDIGIYHTKVAKLQRFELEMLKVHESHEQLVKISERREQLERLARHKLSQEVKRLTDVKQELKDQVDVLTNQIANRPVPSDSDSLRKELNKRDVFIAQLVSQNKELIAAKERQEIELTAQRQTLNEQRTHIDILDSALNNAQANVVKLEEELRKKQNVVEQAGQLKRLLVSMQLAADRREQSEKTLREKLQTEIYNLRMGVKQQGLEQVVLDLREEVRARDEKVLVLEGEVFKWEQRYLQESAMRQLAIEAAGMPKDAKIAALEKNSQESERQLALAKTDKLRQMDELYTNSKRQHELETRNRVLESQMAERDAMVRVLQKRLEEKDAIYQNALLRNTVSAGKMGESGRSSTSSSGTSVVHRSQASSSHSHSSSGAGGVAAGGSVNTTASTTPRRDEELGCTPPIPPFPSNTVSVKSTDYYMSALASATASTTTSASPTSSTSMTTPAISVSAPGSGRLSRRCLQQLAPPPDKTNSLDRHHHQRSESLSHHCRGTTTSSSADLDAALAAQDMQDIDETNLGGSVRMVCFPGLAHSGSEAREGQVSQPLLARVEHLRNGITPSPRHPSPQQIPITLQQRPASHISRMPPREVVPEHELRACTEAPCHLPTPPPPPPPIENQVIQRPEHLSLPLTYFQDVTVPIPLPPPRDVSSTLPDIQQSFNKAALSPLHGVPPPPPYHGIHTVISNNNLATGMQSPTSFGSPDPGSSPYSSERSLSPCSTLSPASPDQATPPELHVQRQCFYPHPPTVACRKCNSVRLSNRHNAAILVRRANSNAEAKRTSAQMVCGSSGGDSSEDDSPSILERLRREWKATIGNNKLQFDITHSPPQSPPLPAMQTPIPTQTPAPTQSPAVQQLSLPLQPPARQYQALKQSSPLPPQTISSHIILPLQQSSPQSQSPPTNLNSPVPSPPPQSPPLHRPPQSPKRSPQPPGRSAQQIRMSPNPVSASETPQFDTHNTANNNTKSNHLQVPNNKNANDQKNKNNLNEQNANQYDKIELIILEDTDELKSSCTKEESLQPPFQEEI
ncbi:unnamed protein product, partial [Meganyctiphanes norvegica]